ncbi:MAG TPA: NAD-dependent epimerase/dehydratase family protein [Flavobacteriaceae bacterium]|nr:NAD-dependent epimerase/dehydratase family protein [Flavobacteriaceae bacterium]
MILVTGGTGLVGSHLLYRLTQTHTGIKAIYRSEKKIDLVKRVFSYYSKHPEELLDKIEWISADITDVPSLENAINNVTHVYHCAAFVSFEPDKYHLLRKVNIEGTANVVNVCLAKKVSKLCYVSSVAALGDAKENYEINEDSYWNPEAEHSVYSITKYGAEMEVWRGIQEGLPAVIVNPGVIIGPGIWRHGSGSLFTKVHKGLRFYTQGSIGLIDVNDVINSMVYLMENPYHNERYLLVSENWTYQKFFTTLANRLSKKPAEKELKPWVLQLLWRIDWVWHKLTGKRRRLPKSIAKTLTRTVKYNPSKIKSVLQQPFQPIEKSIEKTGAFFLKDFGSK